MPRQAHVGIKHESVYGTAPGGDYDLFSEAESESIEMQRTYTDILVQRSPVIQAKEEMQRRVLGDLNLQANYHDLAPYLHVLFGSSDTGASGGNFQHRFPAVASGLVDTEGVSCALEVARDDEGDGANTWRYSGIKLLNLELAGNLTDPVSASFGVHGKGEAIGTISSSPTFKDAHFLLQKHAYMTFDGGSTKLDMQTHSIRFDWPKDEPFAHRGASADPEEFAAEPRQSDIMRISGEVQVLFQDTALTEYGYIGDGLTHDVEMHFERSADQNLQVHMPTAVVLTGTPHKDGRGRRIATFAFEQVGAGAYISLLNDDDSVDW